MLGHRLAAKSARDRANSCTYGRAQRSGSDRASRGTGSDTAYRCAKAPTVVLLVFVSCLGLFIAALSAGALHLREH